MHSFLGGSGCELRFLPLPSEFIICEEDGYLIRSIGTARQIWGVLLWRDGSIQTCKLGRYELRVAKDLVEGLPRDRGVDE